MAVPKTDPRHATPRRLTQPKPRRRCALDPSVCADAARQAGELLDRLRLLIHYSPQSQRQIEGRAGLSRGYLSQILAGHLPLRVEHLLALVLALELEPAEFFDGLFAESRYRSQSPQSPRRRDLTQALSLELARRYGVGLDSLEDLLSRLEDYESSLRRLESSKAPLAGPRSSASLCDG